MLLNILSCKKNLRWLQLIQLI